MQEATHKELVNRHIFQDQQHLDSGTTAGESQWEPAYSRLSKKWLSKWTVVKCCTLTLTGCEQELQTRTGFPNPGIPD